MDILLRNSAFARKGKKADGSRFAAHNKNEKTALSARGREGKRRMKNDMMNSDLYLGMGLGLAVGVVSTLLMRPKRKDLKSVVARVIGDMADSVSKNMGW